jgi:hypothetical protein
MTTLTDFAHLFSNTKAWLGWEGEGHKEGERWKQGNEALMSD